MVSFKKLALVGTASALFTAVCGMPTLDSSNGNTALGVRGVTADSVEAPERRAPETLSVIPSDQSARSLEENVITKRDIKMRLWWAQGGQVLFLLGRGININRLPQELQDMIAGHIEGAPGQMLLRNFYNFVQRNHRDVYEWLTEQLPDVGAQIGAMWGTAERRGDYGFAINIPDGHTNPGSAGAQLLAALVTAIHDWAGQNGAGNMVAEQQRANGFFNPNDIGGGPSSKRASKRSRTDQCPAKDYNVLKIADEVVPNDVDFKKYYRWANPCS